MRECVCRQMGVGILAFKRVGWQYLQSKNDNWNILLEFRKVALVYKYGDGGRGCVAE